MNSVHSMQKLKIISQELNVAATKRIQIFAQHIKIGYWTFGCTHKRYYNENGINVIIIVQVQNIQ